MRNLIVLFAVLGLVACGNEGTTGEPGTGQIRVQVQGVATGAGPAAGDIDSIVVTAVDEANRSHEIELVNDGSGNWSGESDRLYTGPYQVSAEAFDAADTVIFASKQTEVVVVHDETVTVILVLNQIGAPTEFDMPRITSVVLDRWQVEQGDPIQVTVGAEGGQGDLVLTGRHALSAQTPGTFDPADPVDFTGGTATFDWIAPMQAGPAWFVVRVTDVEGNSSELGITVWVGRDYGFLDVDATFNLAPSLSLTTRVLNETGMATFYFENVVADDPENTGDVAYAWSSDCDVVWSDESYYEPAQGTLEDGGAGVTFKAQLVGVDRPEFCTFTLEGRDVIAVDGELVEGATSTLIVRLQAREATNLFLAVFEQDFGVGGDFLANPTATGNGMFSWTRNGAAAKNITAPIAYFLHKAGFEDLAAEAFLEMYLRTSADPEDPDNFNAMDLGVLLYAWEVTGIEDYRELAEDMWPTYKSKYGVPTTNTAVRSAYFGYDAFNLMLGVHMAQKYGLDGAVEDWEDLVLWYEVEAPLAVAADPWHTTWTNLIARDFGAGTFDPTFDALAIPTNVQTIAYAVFADSVRPDLAAEYLFTHLPEAETSQVAAEGLAGLRHALDLMQN